MMVPYRIVTDRRSDKVTGDQHLALVDQLVKSMLPIGSRFPPHNRPRRPTCRITVAVDAFAIAFHIALLKIGGKTVHILIIRKDRFRLRTEEVRIPEPDQRHGNGYVLFERGCLKMKV